METWNNGPHLLEFEPPDIFHCHVRGPIEAHDMAKTIEIVRDELGEKRGIRVYFLAYMEAPNSTFTADARKTVISSKVDWKAAVFVGGNAIMRTATNILAHSVNLLHGKARPFKMVKTAEEARQYIAEHRAKEAAEAAASKH